MDKRIVLSSILIILLTQLSWSQIDINRVLAAGTEDTKRFAESYLAPGLDAVAYSLTSGWFTSAKSKKLGQFEISFIGNAAFVPSSKSSFELNTADYNFLEFESGPSIQRVATVLGENDPSIQAVAVFEDENGNQQSVSFALPQGLANSGIEQVPTLFPQLSIGFLGGLEFKFRYLPEIDTDDGSVQFYGIGVQNEITDWLPGAKLLPFHIGIAANYSRFAGDAKLGDTPIVDSNNGFLETEFSSWSVSALVSTKWKVFNFYGGLSYINADSDFGLKGDFTLNDGVNSNRTISNPFVTSSSLQGFRGTLGAKLTLAFFRIHADYSVQEFNTISAGISFGI